MNKVAVVILNWNGAEMLRRYLPSVIAPQPEGGEYDVWVADNASTDNSMNILKDEFPSVKTIVLEKNWGFADGYNKALEQIEADYYVLLNSDVEVAHGWLKPLLAYMESHKDTAAVQPKLLKAPPTPQEETFEYAGASGGFIDKYGYPYCRGRIFGVVEKDNGQYDDPLEIHWATGACLMIRAKDYWNAGGLDGRFFAHNEEIDLCWRLRISGKKIMCLPESKVYHLGGGTLPQGNPRKTYLNFRNNLTMLYKNLHEKSLKKVMYMRYFLDRIAALQSLLKGNTADAKAIMKARKDFKEWKNNFKEDRMKIQANRQISSDRDLTPLSILWQFYALGKKTWSKLPLLLTVMILICNTPTANADDKTRGIGVYPGRLSESFAPSLVASDSYRNLALNRAAYHSSSYDFNLTAQLVTDGIKSQAEPARIEVLVNGKNLPKRDREWAIDGNEWSHNDINGEKAEFRINWIGMEVAPVDSIVLYYTVIYDAAKANAGYSIKVNALNKNGEQSATPWELSDKNLPGRPWGTAQSTDPNKQSEVGKLPVRKMVQRIPLNATAPFSSLNFNFEMKGADHWSITEIKFFKDGKAIDTELLPSSQFQSAWLSESGDDQWVYVDLGAQAQFDKVRLYWMHIIPTGLIEVSNDAKTWKAIAQLPTDKGQSYEIPVNGKGRYVKVHLNGPTGSRYMLTEFEVMGRGGLVAKPHAEAAVEGNKWYLNGGNWRVQRESEIKADAPAISSEGMNTSSWIPATVPGTVLTSYVNAGAVADQNFDENIFYTSESFFNSNFWYRREFKLPAEFIGKRVFLNLDGINWKANVWVNGKKVSRVEGAFIRNRVDITSNLTNTATNVLAIEIERCAHPGAVKEKNTVNTDYNGGLLGFDNPTFHATVGWDWISTIRGRDIGVWNDVFLTAEEAVTLHDPFVDVKLNQPDTLATLTPAICIYNNVGKTVKGTIHGWIGPVKFQKQVEVRPGEDGCIFNPSDFPELQNQRLRLWWPNGYGEPYLYDAGFTFVDENGNTLSTVNWKQGIRQMTYTDKQTKLKIYVNGKRVVPLGGNWGFSEQNLNYRAREYDTAIRYHRDMNFNMIRNWVGQTGDKEFYEVCDKYGIMVWQDFWLANPADGPDPKDEEMFLDNALDMVSRIRQHASIAIYCGRNEGYPPKTLDESLYKMVMKTHPGLEYISSSADDGVSGHGPYWAIPAKEYFERQTGQLHSERGMPNVMTFEGLKRTLREEHLWPQSTFWGQHDYTMEGAQRGATFNKLIAGYGNIDSAERFSKLGQFVNYDGYRGMYESGSKDRMGLLIWMSHACWPSMTWQCYDYFFEPTAAYFGCKKACEPLHIQYNASTKNIEVVNLGVGDAKKLKATVEVFDLMGNLISANKETVNSLDDSVTMLKKAVETSDDNVSILRLTLTKGKKLISQNTYLLTGDNGDYTALSEMPEAEIKTTANIDGQKAIITLENTSKTPAMLIRLNLKDGAGEQILPVMYEDNYFHLLPGEKRTFTITWLPEDQHNDGAEIEITGLNLR